MRAILFDLDGTLADSLPFLKSVFSEFLRTRNIRAERDDFRHCNGLIISEIVQFLKQKYKLNETEAELTREYQSRIFEGYGEEVQLQADVPEVLRQIKSQSIRLALVTSSLSQQVVPFLKKNNIEKLFDIVVTGGEQKAGKPDPALYREALFRMGLSSDQVIAIEDSENGIHSAERAGISNCVVFGRTYNSHYPHFTRYRDLPILLDSIQGPVLEQRVYHLDPKVTLKLFQHELQIDNKTKLRIDEIWDSAVKTERAPLTNGRILALDGFYHPNEIECHFVDYKSYIAQKKEPALYSELKVDILAVSGIVQVGNYILFGRRSEQLANYAGFWELAPSGGVDGGTVKDGVRVDPLQQLLREFTEEIGVEQELVTSYRPHLLVYSEKDRTWDIGIHLKYLGDSNSFKSRLRPTAEYSEFRLISKTEVMTFIEEHADEMVPTSVALARSI